jgi:hypothetical protein
MEREQTCGREFCVKTKSRRLRTRARLRKARNFPCPDIRERSCSSSLCTLADCENDVLRRRRELTRRRKFAQMVQNVVGIDREEKALIEKEQRRQICTIGRRMYARGLVVAAEGNLSVRLDAERIIVTPSGACKGHLASEDLLVTDLNGNVLSGKRRPSSEMQMHLLYYRSRPSVRISEPVLDPRITGGSHESKTSRIGG